MTRRLLVPEGALASERVELSAELAHYVRNVLRLEVGGELILIDGRGGRTLASILELTKNHARLRRGDIERVSEPAPPAITLIQAIAKHDKVDQVVRQSTELGVRRFVPVITARAIGEKKKRVERWRTIAEDALRVSDRAWRPEIETPVLLAEVFARPRAEVSLCLAGSVELGLKEALPASASSVEVLIGPEGGLDASELEAARSSGFQMVQLGPHTLRTETAGPATIAALAFHFGLLG